MWKNVQSLFLAALAVWATLTMGAFAHSFSSCGLPSAQLQLQTIKLQPDPPVAGQPLSVLLDGHTHAAIAAGSVELSVGLYGITIAAHSFDLCSNVVPSCPVAAGSTFLGNITYTIPTEAPAGVDLAATVQVKGAKNQELACVKLDVAIAAAAAGAAAGAANTAVKQHIDAQTYWVEALFKAWQTQFGVHVRTLDEYVLRLASFTANHKLIVAHNTAPGLTWRMGHNAFSHMTPGEFKATMLLSPLPWRSHHNKTVNSSHVSSGAALPPLVDWVSAGAVTPVKNQGQCGSCWAFSTTGALEGALFLATHKLVSLSEQMIVDCDTTDSGCNGGLMDNAFNWVASRGGVCAEAAYAYTAQTGACQKGCALVPGTAPKQHTDVEPTDEALMAAIAGQPVSLAIEADQSGFQFYSSGVFTGECGTALDHGVLGVGYGPASGTEPAYYKVKNSWGSSWGDAGYIKIEKGNKQTGGLCGILTSASFPTL